MGNLVGRSLAHFHIEAQLGEGGMGVVYRATDEKLRRQVALKVLPEALAADSDRRGRFLREARAAAAITHNNIAAVYEVGEADGHVFIAMELVKGYTLRERMAPGLTHAEAWRIAKDIAKGLARAHESGVVHRDLKPENVMVTPDGDVKILDFGLAKLIDADTAVNPTGVTATQMTMVGRAMGTPPYMSPEQAEGRAEIDARTDVFSFGVMLYEMLAGVRPFEGDTTMAVLFAVVHKEPQALEVANPGVPPIPAAVVVRCLRKAPGERFASGREVLVALGAESAVARAAVGKALPPARAATESRAGMALETTAVLDDPEGVAAGAGHDLEHPALGTAQRGTATASVTGSGTVDPQVPRAALRGGRIARVLVACGLILALATWGTTQIARRPMPSAGASAGSGSGHPAPPAELTSSSATTYSERRLTSLAADAHVDDATLTRDGNSVVFADGEGFWIQEIAGGARRPLGTPRFAEAETGSISSLDDAARVFLSATDSERVHGWVAPLDGGAPQLVYEGVGREAIVAPSGTRLAVIRSDRDGIGIAAMAGGPLVPIALSGVVETACFSPDGSHLAVVTNMPDAIVVATVDGGTVTRTYADPSLNSHGSNGLAWPDPGRLLFTSHSQVAGAWSLREMTIDPDGRPLGPPRELWRTSQGMLAAVSSRGGRTSVLVVTYRDEIRVAGLAMGGRRLDGPPHTLTRSEATNFGATWLPDGRLVFFSDRDSQDALYVQALDAPEPKVIVAPTINGAKWRANEALNTGDLIYARPEGDAGASRVMVGTPGGAERQLARIGASADDAYVRCGGGDPTRCVLGIRQAGTLTLARIDVGNGKIGAPFYRVAGLAEFAVAPDGSHVAVMTYSPTITIVDTTTGRSHAMTTTPTGRVLQHASFTPDGKTLLITGERFDMGQYGLIAVDLEGHGALLQVARDAWMAAPRISPDGRRLALSARTYSANVWLLTPSTTSASQ